MAIPEEHVLVIPRRLFDDLGAFQGLCTDTRRYVAALRDAKNYQFLARTGAENDPSFKQVIPYFGIGGHINHLDQDLFGDLYARAAERELREELVVPEGATHRIAALLNDDSNDVGKVHLGIVHVLKSPSEDVRKRESVITEAAFRSPAELRGMRDTLETWSQICLDHLEVLLA